MSSRIIEILVNGKQLKVRVVTYLITFWDCTTITIESDKPLPELYQTYKQAQTIEEVD